MRAMKDSGIEWIGEIPQDWETRQIKYTLENHSGGAWGANKGESERDCICVRVADFDYSHLRVNYSEIMTVRSYQQKTICDSALKSGDILLEKSGGGETTPVGRSVLFSSEREMMCANFIEWLRPNFSIQPQFLNYWLSAAYSNGYYKRNIKRTTGIQNLDIPAFLSEKVLVPSGEEQQRISHYLDTKCAEIDALIAAKEKTNALLKERRQSIIYEAVTKGLDPTMPMKNSDVEWIGEIPEGWLVAPLKYFASIRSGFTLGKKYGSAQGLQEYPYLRVANVQGEYTDLENITTIQMPAEEAEQYKLKAGELLMTEGGDRDKLGRGSIWKGEIQNCLHQNHIFALSTDERLSIKYLDYLTASDVGRSYFDYTAVKTTNLASTNATTIMNFKIPIPSVNEQLEIVEYLEKSCQGIDEIIQINSETIQKLKQYRQSLIYEAVTGKIEV